MSMHWRTRHPSTAHFEQLFEYGHLMPGLPQDTKAAVAELAHSMVGALSDGPELSAGLRKLKEASDCFVAQAVIDAQAYEAVERERADLLGADQDLGMGHP